VHWDSLLIARLEQRPDSLVWQGQLRKNLSNGFLQSTFLPTLERCLTDPGGPSWPAKLLRQAEVEAKVSEGTNPQGFQVTFSSPVGVLPQLLTGCRLASGSSEAPYVLRDGVLEARAEPTSGRTPLIGEIRRERSTENADIQLDGPITGKRGSQMDGVSDVVLLLSPKEQEDKDPLGFSGLTSEQRGTRLAAAPLLAAVHQGRGGVTDRLLPEGVALSAPPSQAGRPPPAPLKISLPSTADTGEGGVLKLSWPSDDELLGQIAERLALLASGSQTRCTRAEGGFRLLRFRPRSQDPALALLELAQASPVLAAAAKEKLTDPRLLSADPTKRIEAALELERSWLSSGLAFPLLTTQHWLALDAELRDVELDPTGVPSLHRAWTSAAAGAP